MAIIPDKQDGTVLERQEKAVKPPSMYKVVLLNDDFTPMEFVVMIVQEYFNKDRETATQIMLKVHREGRGVCGVYTRDIAATKVEQVVTHAQAGEQKRRFEPRSAVFALANPDSPVLLVTRLPPSPDSDCAVPRSRRTSTAPCRFRRHRP
jgi:ATP-dependent Clp protease adaptor protein ClpS